MSLKFPGEAGDYVSCGDLDSIGNQFTISCMVKLFDVVGDGRLVGKWGNTVSYRSYLIQHLADELEFAFRAGSTHVGNTTSGLALQANKWYHVIAWRDSTEAFLEVDRNLVIEEDGSPDWDTLINTTDLRFGNAVQLSPMEGLLAEVSLWDRILTHRERSLLSIGVPANKFSTIDLRGYWPCNENTGDTVADLHDESWDGSLEGNVSWGEDPEYVRNFNPRNIRNSTGRKLVSHLKKRVKVTTSRRVAHGWH